MPSRQVLYPPFAVGQRYKIFNNFIPATARLSTYAGEVSAAGIPAVGSGIHRFQTVMPVPAPVLPPSPYTNITINSPNYWQNGDYVGLATNAGGRRKSRRSKRSYRKSKRRHH